MQHQSYRLTRIGTAILSVCFVLMSLAVVPSAARATSLATVHMVTLSHVGGDHFEPCAAPSSGSSLVLVPGETLQFFNDLGRDVQVTFTDVTNNTMQTLSLPQSGIASVTPRANSNFTYSSQGLSVPTCVGKVLGQTPGVQTVLITRQGGFAHFDPCSTNQDNPTLVLQAGETLRFQNNLVDTKVTFVELPQNSTQTFNVPGSGGTVILTPLAGASFSYSSAFPQQTCFGRVLAKTPSTLPPTGGGPIPSLTAGPPWLLWGGLLTILGLAGLGATLFAHRRWLALLGERKG